QARVISTDPGPASTGSGATTTVVAPPAPTGVPTDHAPLLPAARAASAHPAPGGRPRTSNVSAAGTGHLPSVDAHAVGCGDGVAEGAAAGVAVDAGVGCAVPAALGVGTGPPAVAVAPPPPAGVVVATGLTTGPEAWAPSGETAFGASVAQYVTISAELTQVPSSRAVRRRSPSGDTSPVDP